MNEVVAAKVRQAISLLTEFDMPLWIVQFARESYDHPQPVQDLLVGTSITWPAAFIVTATGESIAIVGTGDVANVTSVGAYEHVIGYVKDVGPPLRDVLERVAPERIGVSYSRDDDSADNISHGMFLILEECLQGTPLAERLVSADELLVAVRARKLPIEVESIQKAIGVTLELFAEIEALLKPGIRASEVAATVHRSIERRGLETAWDRHYDPAVNFGPEAPFGHAPPGETVLEPGMLVHVDLGVKSGGYCSDLQRMWYLLRDGETEPPDDVASRFSAVARSMQAGRAVLRPGVRGWEVDAAARALLTGEGYAEPEFALGHQVGRSTHDGGALLGPRWPRYGSRPDMAVEEGHVYTLEYALPSSAGIIGLEEDVLVTEDGAEYLTAPQTELRLLRP